MATAQPDVTAGFALINGGTVYYEAAGAGQPVLLIHAGVADQTMWDDQFMFFAQHYHVIRYAMRGFGKTSSALFAGYSPRQDLLDLLEQVQVTDPIAIIGSSMGAALAIDFAVEHPERVRALVLVAGGLSGFPLDNEAPQQKPSTIEQTFVEQLEDAYKREDYEMVAEMETHYWGDGPLQEPGRMAEDARKHLWTMIYTNTQNHPETYTPTPIDPPAAVRLHDIHVPTLVIMGELDEPEVNTAMNYVVDQVVGARSAHFAAAHMVNMEFPDEFNSLVLDFLHHG